MRVLLISRHSHRELLRTANTVVQMQDTLASLNLHYAALQTWTPEIITIHARNAEKHDKLDRMVVTDTHLIVEGNELRISSAIGFIKACLSVTESHNSLLLCAKAILAGRLAVNTLPKVCAAILFSNNRIQKFYISRCVIAFQFHGHVS